MAKKKLIQTSKKTQKNVLYVLIVLIEGYVAYGIYTALELKKNVSKWWLNIVAIALKDIATTCGIAESDINTITIAEIWEAYNSAGSTIQDNLKLKTNYEGIISWLENKKNKQTTINSQMKNDISWALNSGAKATIFSKILF